MRLARGALLLGALWLGMAVAQERAAAAAAPTEQQLKAVFVFNFSHFVAWPPSAFASPTDPFVIGVLGNDAFAAQVEEAVHDERLDTHPLEVRRFARVDDIQDCRILYIDRSQQAALGRVLTLLDHRDTLTVSDLDDAAKRGIIIQLATEDNRIRLLINTESAHSAGLTISSNLLRLARVAHTGD
ncbi:MAG TPA: YfiR family protein [Steroidobacteraceae bacterium]|nr:YfiR family protein [Steroidobacteraceae bacterium]